MSEGPTTTPYRNLFFCTGNSARSLFAEAIINDEGGGRFRGFSAASHSSTDGPHPYAMDLLKRLNTDTSFARSKTWDKLAEPGVPEMGFVFTVCDQATAEPCPAWPGQPVTAHWGVPNPVLADGTEAARRMALSNAYRKLRNRISVFVSLPIESLNALALKERLDEIGNTTLAEKEETPA